jgi:hypothetical protein
MINNKNENSLPQMAQIGTDEQLRCICLVFSYQKKISAFICANLCHLWQKKHLICILTPLLVFFTNTSTNI